jgi:ribosomal protein L1
MVTVDAIVGVIVAVKKSDQTLAAVFTLPFMTSDHVPIAVLTLSSVTLDQVEAPVLTLIAIV